MLDKLQARFKELGTKLTSSSVDTHGMQHSVCVEVSQIAFPTCALRLLQIDTAAAHNTVRLLLQLNLPRFQSSKYFRILGTR